MGAKASKLVGLGEPLVTEVGFAPTQSQILMGMAMKSRRKFYGAVGAKAARIAANAARYRDGKGKARAAARRAGLQVV